MMRVPTAGDLITTRLTVALVTRTRIAKVKFHGADQMMTILLDGRKNRRRMIFHGEEQVMKGHGTGGEGGGMRQESVGVRKQVMTKLHGVERVLIGGVVEKDGRVWKGGGGRESRMKMKSHGEVRKAPETGGEDDMAAMTVSLKKMTGKIVMEPVVKGAGG